MAGSSTAPQALLMEKRLQLQPGGHQAREITEINGPLTPKVPVINDLHDAAEWLLPHSPEPGHPQKAQSERRGRGSFGFSQQQEHLLSFFPPCCCNRSLFAFLPAGSQPSPVPS